MESASQPAGYETRASLFLRCNSTSKPVVELAWDEFHQRYAPVVAGFARNLGLRAQDVDDVIQEVMLGFFRRSPEFEYDPSKGRFRGYLKVCTVRAIRKRRDRDARAGPSSDVDLDEQSGHLESAWNEQWEQRLLARAAERYRLEATEQAFEVFAGTVLDDQDPAQVAGRLGMSLDAVYKARQRAIARVRAIFQELIDDEP